jgi:manganese/iron transport system ATP-binding protein
MNRPFMRTKTKGVKHKSAAPTLQLNDVSVIYTSGAGAGVTSRGLRNIASQYALQDITFQVDSGQLVAVVGPNGAGKSTLFKLIVGTIRPSAGTVHVFGQGPMGHTCIAYVPQRSQIDWSFPVTVQDVVMMGRVGQVGLFRWPRQRDRQIVGASLERVNAVHLSRKQIGELSGGQQQRIFIARALAQEAELLLMDEPLSGLDAPSRSAIFRILDTLRAEGVTVMMATHDLDLAAERFDQIMLLNRHVIAYGTPSTVLQTANLLQAYGGHEHYSAVPS